MTPALTNPSDIARETLRQLALRRTPPSPENYQALYYEIAGTGQGGPSMDPALKNLLLALPKETSAQQRLARQLADALKGGNPKDYANALSDFIRSVTEENEPQWGDLVREILHQWEARQPGLTQARKRESLEHVTSATTGSMRTLHGRLQSLVRSWARNTLDEGEPVPQDTHDGAPAATPLHTLLDRAPPQELQELFAYALETLVVHQLTDEPEIAAQAQALAANVRRTLTTKAIEDIANDVKRLAFRLELLHEDRAELRSGILSLLQLLIGNISELVIDDRWLASQIEVVHKIVTAPLNIRTIDDAERRLKEVIFKQGQLKQSLGEAQETLKSMLAGFIDHLAEFSDSTSGYHDKIETCAAKISQAQSITQLEDVLAEALEATRNIQLSAQRSRDELQTTRLRVTEAEQRIKQLQSELDKAAELVRQDPLTGALNRRGLEDVFRKESARAERRKTSLCVALLDIDNFKKLNDVLGHEAGDTALVHLVSIIRQTMRPQDTAARFGGEEFIILLPDTELEAATQTIQRLQRELTKHYFLHGNQKVLITFSAGVTEYQAGEQQAEVFKRADDAMYEAKKSGKNRVVSV